MLANELYFSASTNENELLKMNGTDRQKSMYSVI